MHVHRHLGLLLAVHLLLEQLSQELGVEPQLICADEEFTVQ